MLQSGNVARAGPNAMTPGASAGRDQTTTTTVSSFRRHVRAQVLAELQEVGQATRAELMLHLGLSRTALTRVLAGLFDDELIAEDAAPGATGRAAGRPARALRARRPPRSTLAVQVASHAVMAAIVNEEGEIRASERYEVTLADGLTGVVDVIRLARRTLFDSVERPPSRLVVVLPTMIAAGGSSVEPSGARELMPTWIRPGVSDQLRRASGLPATLHNDGRLAALAESRLGSARGARNVLYIAPGANGIGGGLVLDGRLHTGAGAAGEISHAVVTVDGQPCPCGQRGCLAAEVRHRVREFRRTAGLPEIDRDDVGPLGTTTGHSQMLDDIADMIARVAGTVVSIVHPDVIVVADRLTHGPDPRLFSRISASIPVFTHPAAMRSVSVRESRLGEEAALAGAGLVDIVEGRWSRA